MARSFRHVPIHGICGTSDKFDKVHSHRATRMRVRIHLRETVGDSIVLPIAREVKSIWNFAKDGKSYLRDHDSQQAAVCMVRCRTNEKRLILATMDVDSIVVALVRK